MKMAFSLGKYFHPILWVLLSKILFSKTCVNNGTFCSGFWILAGEHEDDFLPSFGIGSTKRIIVVLKSKHSPVCPWQDYHPYLHSLYACLLEIQSCKKCGHLHFCKRQIRFRKMSLIICIRQRTRKNCFCKKLREDHNLHPHKTNFQNKTVDLPIIFNQNIGSL